MTARTVMPGHPLRGGYLRQPRLLVLGTCERWARSFAHFQISRGFVQREYMRPNRQCLVFFADDVQFPIGRCDQALGLKISRLIWIVGCCGINRPPAPHYAKIRTWKRTMRCAKCGLLFEIGEEGSRPMDR